MIGKIVTIITTMAISKTINPMTTWRIPSSSVTTQPSRSVQTLLPARALVQPVKPLKCSPSITEPIPIPIPIPVGR